MRAWSSADAILDKVRDVRTSVAESISIREAEAAFEYEPAAESDDGIRDVGEPDYAAEAASESEQTERATEYEQPAQTESAQVRPSGGVRSALGRGGTQRGRNSTRPRRSASRTHRPPLRRLLTPSPTSLPTTPSSDDTINIDQAESTSDESAADQPLPSEVHPTDDGHREGQEANGEARYRRGSGVVR